MGALGLVVGGSVFVGRAANSDGAAVVVLVVAGDVAVANKLPPNA